MSNQAANRGTLKSLADLRCGSMSPIRSTESRMPVCDAIKLSMEPGSEAGLVRQLLSPDDPSTRDTVVKAGKSERYPTFRGILGYIRVNKTLTLQVQFRSRKSWFFSQEGQFEDHSPVDRWTEEIWKISFWNNLDKLVVRAIRRYCEE